MDEAEVAHHIHDPEILVAGRGLHDLLGRGKFDQRRVLELRVDRDDVLRVVLHGARRRILRDGGNGGESARASPAMKINVRFMRQLLSGWEMVLPVERAGPEGKIVGKPAQPFGDADSARSIRASSGCRGRCWSPSSA